MREYTHVSRLEPIVLVSVGGFAGAILRYAVELVAPSSMVATFLVNVTGSFALGVLLYAGLYGGPLPERANVVIGTGFLSSFTTYSMFALDVATNPELALLYVLASYGFGFGAIVVGQLVVLELNDVSIGRGTS